MIVVATYMDEDHIKGNDVTRKKVVAYLLDKYNIRIHKITARRIIKKIGLKWETIIPPVRRYPS